MPAAAAFIDWISYTKANDGKKFEYPTPYSGADREVVWAWQKDVANPSGVLGEVVYCRPNRPFADARMDKETSARIEWGGGSDRILCSYPGTTCRLLRQAGRTAGILARVCSDVTRIDLSVDFRTETDPFEFCNQRDKNRHRVGALMFSEEGKTQYVGSWSSDRFARVYRYNPPHERADFLRVEHVFKGKQAKALAAKLVNVSPVHLIRNTGEIYGWGHPIWEDAINLSETPEEVIWYKEERKISNTLKWLQETAIPCVARLVREGEIADPEEWFKANLDQFLYNEWGQDRPVSDKLKG